MHGQNTKNIEQQYNYGFNNGDVISCNSWTYNETLEYLDTNHNYQKPYTPKYPGSPATKKYVDDTIANSITSALGGEY